MDGLIGGYNTLLSIIGKPYIHSTRLVPRAPRGLNGNVTTVSTQRFNIALLTLCLYITQTRHSHKLNEEALLQEGTWIDTFQDMDTAKAGRV